MIVDRARDALAQLKLGGSPEQLVDYLVVLAALVPEKAAARDPRGWARRVAERLGVQWGSRKIKATGALRPRAFASCMETRNAFDAAVDLDKGPLKVGDTATSHGQLCTILEIDHEADTCKLGFSESGVNAECDYACIYKGTSGDRAQGISSRGCCCAAQALGSMLACQVRRPTGRIPSPRAVHASAAHHSLCRTVARTTPTSTGSVVPLLSGSRSGRQAVCRAQAGVRWGGSILHSQLLSLLAHPLCR